MLEFRQVKAALKMFWQYSFLWQNGQRCKSFNELNNFIIKNSCKYITSLEKVKVGNFDFSVVIEDKSNLSRAVNLQNGNSVFQFVLAVSINKTL